MLKRWLVALLCLGSGAASAGPPLVHTRLMGEGGPAILIDGTPHAPVFLAANNQFGRDGILLEEIAKAHAAGFPLYTFNLPAPLAADTAAVEACVEQFAGVNPEGYFLVRVWLGADEAWRAAHPDALLRDAAGDTIGYVSPAHPAWREEVSARLTRSIQAITQGPHAGRFLGVMLNYLQTGEWFYPETERYWDYSDANRERFRAWLRAAYASDAALRAAWGEPAVSLDTAAIPSPQAREAVAWGLFRHPVSGRPAQDFSRYTSEMMADTIAHFARVAKAATGGRSLVGAFYGYTFELNHNSPRALQQSGHTALARLLAFPDIDFISAPYSYFERAPGQPGHYHLPVDSLALHGKLGIIEDDTFTDASIPPPDGLITPGNEARPATPELTNAVARRNFGSFLSHGCGLWWFDLLSDGRWNADTFWASTPILREVASHARSLPAFSPEIAFLVDEEALASLRDTTHPQLLHALGYGRAPFARIGAPVGYYLQSDLPRLPASIKLLYLATPFAISDAAVADLTRRQQAGATIVWGWMPGQANTLQLDTARVHALTGFHVEQAPGIYTPQLRDAQGELDLLLEETDWTERLNIVGQDSQPLAYHADGKVACASRPAGPGRAVLCTLPRLSDRILRLLCTQAGVTLHSESLAMISRVGNYEFHTPMAPPGETRLLRLAPQSAPTVIP